MDDARQLGPDSDEATWRLGSVTFGYGAERRPDGWSATVAGRTGWGVFDAGLLVGKAVDREQGHWFGGRLVPATGVAGVAVVPEMRGRGVARRILTRLLAAAHDRGAVISTLFPTTPTPYRRLGWEQVGYLTYTAWPTTALAATVPHPGVELRPAVEADVPSIERLYRDFARAATGMLERSGPLFTATPAQLLAGYHGVTVAVDRTGVVGYASWNRGPGYDATSSITVDDLIGATPGALSSLLWTVGGWASVAPVAVLRLTPTDPALFLIPSAGGTVHTRHPWMLRVVDAAGAIAARGFDPAVRGEVELELLDVECPWQAGPHRLVLAGGAAHLEPGGGGRVRMTPRGFAAWYAGAASPAALRRAGLIDGDTASDAILAAATAGPPPVLHDYF